jgi:hypothetical protein
VVQESLLRLHLALQAGEKLASARAFVATVGIRSIVNPDELAHIGPVADFTSLLMSSDMNPGVSPPHVTTVEK